MAEDRVPKEKLVKDCEPPVAFNTVFDTVKGYAPRPGARYAAYMAHTGLLKIFKMEEPK